MTAQAGPSTVAHKSPRKNLAKTRNMRYTDSCCQNISSLGQQPGEERTTCGCLKRCAHNPSRDSKREEHLLIFSAVTH
jgi:hypothetical protein